MHERFCLNTATIKNTPLHVQIQLAREAGFHQIGLWLKDVEAAVAEGTSLGEIRMQLESSRLRVAELCFLGGWQDAEGARVKEVLRRAHHICKVAQTLGCDIIVAVPASGPGWLDVAPERFRQICHVAAEYGVRIALEFPGIAAEVKDLRGARDLVAAAACPNGGLVIDTFHFFLGGSTVADFELIAPAEIFLVHVSDAMNLPLEILRIPHDNRTFPGDGIIDFAPIFKHLDRLHYNGTISLEIWNRELHQSNPASVMKKGCESLQRIETMIRQSQTVAVRGMYMGYFHRLQRETPTRLWINNPTLEEAGQAIAAGAIGCTTNPSYVAKVIKMERERALRAIREGVQESPDDQQAADRVQQVIVKEIMDKFLELYERDPGRQGLVSIQGNPHFDDSVGHILDEALRFRKLSQNFITKIPCTAAGLKAFAELIPEDMPIIATEVFAMAQAIAVCELYLRVSQRCGKHPPFYVTHISGIFDECLAKTAKREGIAISPQVVGQAGCILARRQYAMMRKRGYDITLMGGGARGTQHFTEMVGGALDVTINWSTADEIIQADPPITARIDAPTPKAVIDELCDKLPDFRKAYLEDGLAVEQFADFAPLQYFRDMFVKGWDTLLQSVREERSKVLATG